MIPQQGKASLIGRISLDITEQQQIRQELELARFALDRAGVAVFWLTPDARVVYANDVACHSLGYSCDELLTLGVPDFDVKITQDKCASNWNRIKTEGTVRFESIHRRKGQTEFPVEITADYLVFGDKEYNCSIVRDISERRRNQQELQRLHKMEALGQLTGGIAHDFHNILASILGFSDLGLMRIESGDTAKREAYLREIHTAGQRGKELVGQMMRSARSGGSEQQPLQIQSLIKEVIKLLQATLPSSILIEQELEEDTPAIMADPVQIHQALMNLCVNARDAMQGKGVLMNSMLSNVAFISTLSY